MIGVECLEIKLTLTTRQGKFHLQSKLDLQASLYHDNYLNALRAAEQTAYQLFFGELPDGKQEDKEGGPPQVQINT